MMDKQHPVGELLSGTLEKIREMVDVNTVVGTPIRVEEGVTLIPVSKLSLGFGGGGGDFIPQMKKADTENGFGGGAGAGVNITPVAFLVVKQDSVKLLPIEPAASSALDRALEALPDLVEKVSGFIEKKTKEKAAAEEMQEDGGISE